MDFLVLRFRGPMMSFGDVAVDEQRPIDRFPGVSMVTGLVANALGWDWSETEKLQALQDRLVLAVREDLAGERLREYQTVALPGKGGLFVTHSIPCSRNLDKPMTVQKYLSYWANSLITCFIALTGLGTPTLDEVACALKKPARPLFLGRKTCLPTEPVFRGEIFGAESPEEAVLRSCQLDKRPLKFVESPHSCVVEWPYDGRTVVSQSEIFERRDLKQWKNNIHGGSRLVVRRMVSADRFKRR